MVLELKGEPVTLLVKVTESITLHNDTSLQTTFALHSHSLGGDTSDTNKTNTAWVRTL